MSVPQGNLWQILRSQALDSVPAGCRCPPGSPPTLESWLRSGAYSVQSASKKIVTIEAPIEDVGALLFAEAGLLLDHAQEHAIQARHHLAGGRWASPAWSVVTVYYWSYYLVMAITRMIGEAPWFLSRAEALLLSGLSPGDGKVGPGLRVLTCRPAISATMRVVELRQSSQTRVHDAVWRTWFGFLRPHVTALVEQKLNTAELRLYLPQVKAANAIGDSWPSDLRNLVNYVPGLAYGAARGRVSTSAYSGLSAARSETTDAIIGRLESAAAALSGSEPLRSQLVSAARTLTSMTIVLDLIANALFDEVASRHGLDRRWVGARSALRSSQWAEFDGLQWPVDVDAA